MALFRRVYSTISQISGPSINYSLLIGHWSTKFANFKTFTNIREVNHNACGVSNDGVRSVPLEKFEETLERGRKEAERSIVVQVQSEQSCAELYEHCSQFGTVSGMHHYTLHERNHYVIIEYEHKRSVEAAMRATCFSDRTQIVPVRSPFVWFRANSSDRKSKLKKKQMDIVPLSEANRMPSAQELTTRLSNAESVCDQMAILYEATRLDDVGRRLRYLTAHQVELALSGPFPYVRALPFGSSVNGFGKLGCDLDLVLQFDTQTQEDEPECRLVHHAKICVSNGRMQIQRQMEVIGDLIHIFLPACSHLKRILNARVPIVKYTQELTGIDCDLSMTNMTAVYMSEMLHVYASMDKSVQPLVFTVKQWAHSVNLTNPVPGRWITNFSLTLLVLFYLQETKILLPLATLYKLAEPCDKRFSDDAVNCSFLRDVTKLRKPKLPDMTLSQLLHGFFEFYASFDFTSNAISLVTGSHIPKPESSALYIVNPLERSLNVSKNVSPEETHRLKIELRNAAWALESTFQGDTKKGCWGLMELFKASTLSAKSCDVFSVHLGPKRAPRMVNVNDLFEANENVNHESTRNETVRSNKFSHRVRKLR